MFYLTMKKFFTFDFRYFRGDLFGGLTAGIVALPLALAFGVSSGLGPSAGLYGAIFVSFFAALFGGTPTQISGPTAPMTAVSMVFIAEMLANFDGNIEKALPTILSVSCWPDSCKSSLALWDSGNTSGTFPIRLFQDL